MRSRLMSEGRGEGESAIEDVMRMMDAMMTTVTHRRLHTHPEVTRGLGCRVRMKTQTISPPTLPRPTFPHLQTRLPLILLQARPPQLPPLTRHIPLIRHRLRELMHTPRRHPPVLSRDIHRRPRQALHQDRQIGLLPSDLTIACKAKQVASSSPAYGRDLLIRV